MRPSGLSCIHLYSQPVDMRKSFEGLSHLVDSLFPGKLLTGSLFLFLNRRRDMMKILYWEGDGYVIWFKRLEQGTFSSCFDSNSQLTRQQFTMLIEGIVPKRLNRRFNL